MKESLITNDSVSEEMRLQFWPKHFGKIPQWTLLEPRAFAWMDRLCEAYKGGYWNYYTLSNGGAFIAPDSEDSWAMFNKLNGNSAEMSSEAAGIAVCLLNWSHHACRTGSHAMIEHYYRLREFALRHPESNAIMHIID